MQQFLLPALGCAACHPHVLLSRVCTRCEPHFFSGYSSCCFYNGRFSVNPGTCEACLWNRHTAPAKHFERWHSINEAFEFPDGSIRRGIQHYVVFCVHFKWPRGWRCTLFGILLRRVLAHLTWLILPVVICLSQRLSHACLSISSLLRNCEWLIITVIIS